MPDAEKLPSVEELLRQYLSIVLSVNGFNLVHWDFARVLHSVVRRILEQYYFQADMLSPQQETELFDALQELHKCPLGNFGVPGTWWQVQERLRRVVPLALRLAADRNSGGTTS